jgi:Flp pilus assembly protein protease CpaA
MTYDSRCLENEFPCVIPSLLLLLVCVIDISSRNISPRLLMNLLYSIKRLWVIFMKAMSLQDAYTARHVASGKAK